ncbi:Pecanex-like protein 1 [Rhizomonospora bruguierae]|uniref:Pecanex-like protein 1 n=1 Tax=Rhizomonospora bruguierae TaxID=1581705 RepID=UPI001BD0C010|nr:Pecanex-like protein 1 [Micromonospora sp. NBRC 107566]
MHQRSAQRGGSAARYRNKRVFAVIAALATFGAVAAVAQFANAGTRGGNNAWTRSRTACTPAPAQPAPTATASPGATAGTVNGGIQNGRQVRNHLQDGANDRGSLFARNRGCTPAPGTGTASGTPSAGATDAGTEPPPAPEILGNNCDTSQLAEHDGFQNGGRCVTTEFGEVGTQDQNPTLLITSAPQTVRVGQAFTLRVSTRNLVRDRFLAAGQGGYYKESSFLTAEGLVRGHFHTACRMLSTTRGAPDPAPVPAFFVATEDGGGGANPDVISIQVTGLPQQGIAQCASWAGDGSHRIPMMQRANQIPAFDSVRIIVQ